MWDVYRPNTEIKYQVKDYGLHTQVKCLVKDFWHMAKSINWVSVDNYRQSMWKMYQTNSPGGVFIYLKHSFNLNLKTSCFYTYVISTYYCVLR